MSIHGLQSDSHPLRIAILGPGAVGGFLAAVFWKQGGVVSCIANPDTVSCITNQGIHLESTLFGEFVAHPQAQPFLDIEPDLLVITTKAPFLSQALERIRLDRLERAIIVPLMNGFEHLTTLRSRFGPHVAVGMISIEVTRQTPCSIIHSSPHARVELASDTDVSRLELEHIQTYWRASGIETALLEQETQVVWRKLARLNAIALTTAASQMPLGFVRTESKWRAQLEGCAAEGAAVAQSDQVSLSASLIMQQIDALPATLSTSLQRDIARGVPSELDAIGGAILRRAALRGIPCPTIESLYNALAQARHADGNGG